jgi:hypothetical protein
MSLRNRRYNSGFQGMVTKCAALIEDGELLVTPHATVGGESGVFEVRDRRGTVLFRSKSSTKAIREWHTENVMSFGTESYQYTLHEGNDRFQRVLDLAVQYSQNKEHGGKIKNSKAAASIIKDYLRKPNPKGWSDKKYEQFIASQIAYAVR